MKKLLAILLSLIFVFSFVACSGNEDSDKTSDNTDNVSDNVSNNIVAGSVEWFNSVFFNNEENGYVTNNFVSDNYTDIKEIDIFNLFDDTKSTISDAEMDELKKQKDFNPEFDTTKVTGKEMDEILTKYAGVKLDDTKKNKLDSFYYLEEYDAYYSNHSDATFMKVTVTEKTDSNDGSTVLKYETETATGEVTLKVVSDAEYQFVSNALTAKN